MTILGLTLSMSSQDSISVDTTVESPAMLYPRTDSDQHLVKLILEFSLTWNLSYNIHV